MITTVPLAGGTAGAVPVQVTGNTPAGCALINQDVAATITLTAGATGPVIATLAPGGQVVWRDPGVFPFARSDTACTLVVTDSASDYSNPAAVAAVTATKLAAQGIPSTFLDGDCGAYSISSGSTSVPITVGQYASLLVSVLWPQPTPTGPMAVRLRFDDPPIPTLPALDLYCTNNNTAEAAQNKWQVPVLAPRLQVTNISGGSGAAASVTVVGNNRPVPSFRQVHSGLGMWKLHADAPAGNTAYPLMAWNAAGSSPLSRMTRANGDVSLVYQTNHTASILLYATWVDETAAVGQQPFTLTGSGGLLRWAHPSVPVYWQIVPSATLAGGYLDLTLSQG